MQELKTIMGSETEFGLIFPAGGDFEQKHYHLLLKLDGILSPVRGQKAVACEPLLVVSWKDKERIFNLLNWWRENLDCDIGDEKDLSADKARRLGLTGQYLENGARFYVDCVHPEYSTPECADPLELVAYERAGEIIVHDAIQRAAQDIGLVHLLKRNWDYLKSSYACHENYLLSRTLFNKIMGANVSAWNYSGRYPLSPEQIIWTAHLASRIIYTGSGRLDPQADFPTGFSLSQRAPFVQHFSALGTTFERAVINTRDRPYADPERYARLHVICGDSNRADWSNLLKYGASAIILLMLEDVASGKFIVGDAEEYQFRKSPERALCKVNFRPRVRLAMKNGRATAVEIQRSLLALSQKWLDRKESAEGLSLSWAKSEVFPRWQFVLDAYEKDASLLDDKLDYRIKQRLLRGAADRGRGRKQLQALDYNYHVVGPGSLFDAMVNRGAVQTIANEAAVREALRKPPATRAALRMLLAAKLASEFDLYSVSWHSVVYTSPTYSSGVIQMPNPASPREFSTQDADLTQKIIQLLDAGGEIQ